jgi:hypothetical protein
MAYSNKTEFYRTLWCIDYGDNRHLGCDAITYSSTLGRGFGGLQYGVRNSDDSYQFAIRTTGDSGSIFVTGRIYPCSSVLTCSEAHPPSWGLLYVHIHPTLGLRIHGCVPPTFNSCSAYLTIKLTLPLPCITSQTKRDNLKYTTSGSSNTSGCCR